MTRETNGHKGSRALDLIDGLVDTGTWTAWNDTLDDIPQHGDAEALRRAATRSGTDESVITGRAEIAGESVTLIVSEFAFLGGSIGRVAGHRIATAIRRATADGLPVVGLPCSGGTRMQEGTPAFLEMAAITGAVVDHRAAGLPYLIYLRHPTTGGVFASWGSLGHVTWAEPDALVGFLGPRVVEGLTGEPIADGVQRAENLLRHALIDDVVPADELRDRLAGLVAALMRPIGENASPSVPQQVSSAAAAGTGNPLSAWDAITATRHPGRPGVRELLPEDAVIIADHGPIMLALSRFGVRTAVVVGQDADRQRTGEFIGPEHLRMVRRGLALARDLRIAVVTVIDTPGAQLSASAEEGGIAGEIARCTAELIALPAPTVSVLLGQGGGGAALSLFPADRRIATVDSWLSPLPPEGASLIVHRDIEHAAEMAAQQHVLSVDLARRSVIDTIVDAPSPSSMPGIRAAIGAALDGIARPSPAARTRVPVAPRIPAVGAIVRDDAGRFLLVQRAHEPQAGLWTVPGGKVEPGESLQQAVIREIAEETGIVIEVLDEAWVVDIPDGMGAVFEVHDFVATPLTTDVTAADDAADAGWFTTEQMRELPLTPGLITYLDRHGLMD
ncbi:carboxyl transferase domain-containing protein [Gordonia sp. NPDC003950]